MLSLSLPHNYQKRSAMGEVDGLDLEDAEELQEVDDKIIARIREDLVQKLSDEKRENRRLMSRKIRQLSEDEEIVEISDSSFIFCSLSSCSMRIEP